MAVSERLLGRYRLGRHLIRAERSGRRPALVEADDGGAFLFAKLWPKTADSPEVRALWNHEARSLLRVAGYPRAAEFFVRLRDLGEDDKRHFVIVDAGERRLLAELLADRRRHPWLRDLNVPANRRRMWEGLKRVATGVSILHAEGTLHRALDASAVFSDTEGNFDFRLSGFEWSLRMVAAAGMAQQASSPRTRMQAPELDKGVTGHSFASDWFDFGVLVTDILGLPTGGKGAKGAARLQAGIDGLAFLTNAEKALVVGLLAADPEFRPSKSSAVLQAISEAASAARNPSLFTKKPLFVGFALGPGSAVTEAIQQVSRESARIDPSDFATQLRFIEKDIRGDVQILVRQLPSPHYVIDGRLLQYKVKKWERGQPTWDVGFCNSVEWPSVDPAERVARLDGRPIEVRRAPDLGRNLARAKQVGIDWPAVLPFDDSQELLDQQQKFTLDFFRLTNQLDALLTAAQLWPVRVVGSGLDGDQTVIDVTPVRDALRDQLAQNLNLPPPDEQMRAFFTGDEAQHRFSEDAEFTIATEGVLGRSEQESRIRWRFKQAADHPSGPRYRFWHEESGAALPEVGDEVLYLIPRDIAGSVAQLKRRHRAIESMRNHASLLTALADPEQARHDILSGDPQPELAGSAKLDASKQRALAGILSTQPLYALQGPPGTGKTHLLEALVSHLLDTDASLRILVSAQGHEAVDIVKRKLERKFSGKLAAERPLMVRLDNEDDPLHARPVSAGFAQRLAASPLARSAPPHLRARAEAAIANTPGGGATLDVKSFEALVRSAANVVFSTSNSGELERMLEGTQRFDWSIVEEAGKAHGFDLALALQASHRLLLIGDQEQLPPFNFAALEQLLGDPLRIKNALTVGYRFAPGLVDRGAAGSNPDQFAADCAAWRDMVHFFGTLYARARISERNGIALATRLLTQHRMHPHIAELVSRAFYEKELETDDERAATFDADAAPYLIPPDGWLPGERLIFLDLPWVQAVRGATGERGGSDGHRRYSNPAEAGLACDVLGQMEPRAGSACHIQLLTPYHAQRRLLADMIREQLAGPLKQLRSREFSIEQPHLGMTVDSFQGGEADVVIASLVRNNDRPKGKGLGILGDGRRLNVLLSRARHKLIIIGSWEFLESRFTEGQPPSREDPLFAIYNFLTVFGELEKEKKARRVKFGVDSKPA